MRNGKEKNTQQASVSCCDSDVASWQCTFILLYGETVCFRYTMRGNRSILNALMIHVLLLFTCGCTCVFVCVCLCTCLRGYVCIWVWQCILCRLEDTQTECVLFYLVRAHICVCVKTWFYVGVCLINCESMWETVCLFIWVSAGEKEQNEEVEGICFQLLSSSQSAHSHTNLFISLLDRREGDRQRKTDNEAGTQKNKYV